MTERTGLGNQGLMLAVAPTTSKVEPSTPSAPRPQFDRLYDEHFDFVSVVLRRLGVPASGLEDATQDVFVVVHRRLGEFEGRSTLKTWLTRIALNVAADHRRRARRKGSHEELPEAVADPRASDPHQSLEHAQAIARLHRLLGTLDDEHRAVFVLMELEELSAPEVSELLGVKLNTVYSRLRVARARFGAALEREQREAP